MWAWVSGAPVRAGWVCGAKANANAAKLYATKARPRPTRKVKVGGGRVYIGDPPTPLPLLRLRAFLGVCGSSRGFAAWGQVGAEVSELGDVPSCVCQPGPGAALYAEGHGALAEIAEEGGGWC